VYSFQVTEGAFPPFQVTREQRTLESNRMSEIPNMGFGEVVVHRMTDATIEVIFRFRLGNQYAAVAPSVLLLREGPQVNHQIPDFVGLGAIFRRHLPLSIFYDVEKLSIRPVFQGVRIGEVHHRQAHI